MDMTPDVSVEVNYVAPVKQTRWKEWLCWWTSGHYWNGSGSRTMSSQEMNTCDYCKAKRSGGDR